METTISFAFLLDFYGLWWYVIGGYLVKLYSTILLKVFHWYVAQCQTSAEQRALISVSRKLQTQRSPGDSCTNFFLQICCNLFSTHQLFFNIKLNKDKSSNICAFYPDSLYCASMIYNSALK